MDFTKFHALYEPVTETGCWIWMGTDDGKGYGQMRFMGKDWRAHRVGYLSKHGSIPDGLFICHKCDTKLCVNPDHLYAGTPADNVRDFMARGVHKSKLRGRQYKAPVTCPRWKSRRLNPVQVIQIYARIMAGELPKTFCKEYGISAQYAYGIRSKARHPDVTGCAELARYLGIDTTGWP